MYLPLNQALLMPIWISRHVNVNVNRGGITLLNPYRACVRLGVNQGPFGLTRKKSFLTIENGGNLVFNGRATFCSGFAIEISKDGMITIGNRFHSSGNTVCTSNTSVEIGDDVLLGWNVIIRDGDGHHIIKEGKRINQDQPISIGSKVWIGADSAVMKGVKIEDGCIIGTRSVVTHDIVEKNSISVGIPSKVIKTDVDWHH